LIKLASRVGLLYHPRVEASQRLAYHLAEVIQEQQRETWIESAWASEEIFDHADDCELLVILGGDGSILRVARASLVRRQKNGGGGRATPPLLTVDFGKLGFLTELQPDDAIQGLQQVLEGNFWLEERRLLRAILVRDGQVVAEHEALNDVVLARGDGPHSIRIALSIDDAETVGYTADAMIVASPTGSTAYALGAGGPIMAPGVDGLLVMPVAPHLALARGFVVPGSSRVTLSASAWRVTVVTLDGQTTLPYEEGDLLHVTQSDAVARFVRMGPRNYFYATLQQKLRKGE
jgi:NAD+ kinase